MINVYCQSCITKVYLKRTASVKYIFAVFCINLKKKHYLTNFKIVKISKTKYLILYFIMPIFPKKKQCF